MKIAFKYKLWFLILGMFFPLLTSCKLRLEREKIIGLVTVKEETTALVGLLANLKAINLRKDLVAFIEECDKADAEQNVPAGKRLNDALVSFQGKEVEGDPYEDWVGNFNNAVINFVKELQKKIAVPPPAA